MNRLTDTEYTLMIARSEKGEGIKYKWVVTE